MTLHSTQHRKTMAPEDVIKVRTLVRPEINGSGSQIVTTVRRTREAHEHPPGFINTLWIADTRGGSAREVYDSLSQITSARWRPCSQTVTFLAGTDRANAASLACLWSLDGSGLAPTRLLPASGNIGPHAWSPSGSELATVVRVQSPKPSSAAHQLRIYDVTSGLGCDIATPAGIAAIKGEPTWSCDGTQLAVSVVFEPAGTSPKMHGVWIYTVDSAHSRTWPITRADLGPPSWSAHGKMITMVAAPEPIQLSRHVAVPNLAANFRILILDADSGALTECPDHDLQVMPGKPSWLSDGRIVVLAGTGLHAALVAYDPALDSYSQLTSGGYVSGFSVDDHGGIAYTSACSDAAAELYYLPANAPDALRVSDINAAATSNGPRADGADHAAANEVAACADGNESEAGKRPRGGRSGSVGRGRCVARLTR